MAEKSDTVIERVKVREVAGVFRSRETLDAAVDALLLAGFDRSDIDLMASVDAVRDKLGGVYAPVEELADVPDVPRQAFIAREDITLTLGGIAGILTYIGATAAAFGVVASGGALALAAAAATLGGTLGGGLGAFIAHTLGQKQARQLDAQLAAGGFVLWIRVHSLDKEEKAKTILRNHRAEAVRVHEIEITKSLKDIPLSSLRPDPWLGSEPLGNL